MRLFRSEGTAHVEVADQGAGFDPQVASKSGRFGLAFMRERMRLIGGVFEIDSAPGRGTRIGASVPLLLDEVPHD